jgi:hypothetical protein
MDGHGGGRGWVLAVAALAVVGCTPRKPPLVAAFRNEVTIYVAVSNQVAKTDSGNVAAMVDTIESELREEGRSVSIVAARLDERPPVPRVELQVASSDSGDAQLRGAGQLSQLLGPVTGVALLGAGSGHMRVDAYLVPADGGKARFVGRYESSSFGAISDQETAAGERVGDSIAHALLRRSF